MRVMSYRLNVVSGAREYRGYLGADLASFLRQHRLELACERVEAAACQPQRAPLVTMKGEGDAKQHILGQILHRNRFQERGEGREI